MVQSRVGHEVNGLDSQVGAAAGIAGGVSGGKRKRARQRRAPCFQRVRALTTVRKWRPIERAFVLSLNNVIAIRNERKKADR